MLEIRTHRASFHIGEAPSVNRVRMKEGAAEWDEILFPYIEFSRQAHMDIWHQGLASVLKSGYYMIQGEEVPLSGCLLVRRNLLPDWAVPFYAENVTMVEPVRGTIPPSALTKYLTP